MALLFISRVFMVMAFSVVPGGFACDAHFLVILCNLLTDFNSFNNNGTYVCFSCCKHKLLLFCFCVFFALCNLLY